MKSFVYIQIEFILNPLQISVKIKNWKTKKFNSILFTVQTECSMTSDSESEDESTSTRLSFASICKFTTFFREVIADHIMETQREHKIGGVGLHVEIDESMFGKR